jgi:hypothetical protein
MGRLIASLAKGAITGTGEDDCTDRSVVARFVKRLNELVAGGAAKRNHLFQAVDDDPCHAIAVFVNNVFKFHDVFLKSYLPLTISHSSSSRPIRSTPVR